MTDEELQEAFTRELIDLEQSGAGLPFILSPAEAWYLLSNLQLSLRHPMNSGAAAEWIKQFSANIQARLCTGRPAMTELAARGWNAAYDQPATKENE